MLPSLTYLLGIADLCPEYYICKKYSKDIPHIKVLV